MAAAEVSSLDAHRRRRASPAVHAACEPLRYFVGRPRWFRDAHLGGGWFRRADAGDRGPAHGFRRIADPYDIDRMGHCCHPIVAAVLFLFSRLHPSPVLGAAAASRCDRGLLD